MIKNYFKTAFRNIYKNGVFSAINILGLSVGLTGFIIILLYLNYEKSYDSWDPSLKDVYRVGIENDKGIAFNGRTQGPLAAFLKENVKEVQAATSISGGMDFEFLVEANGKKIYQNGLVQVDSLFFSVFPYRLLRGNVVNALNKPDAVVISRNVAKRFFGSADPMGQTIKIHGGFAILVITGVFEPVSTPTELKAEILYRSPWEKQNNQWNILSFSTYITVSKPADDKVFWNDITGIYVKKQFNLSGEAFSKYMADASSDKFFTERLDKIHTQPRSGGSKTGTIEVLLLLAAVLLIAGAINFSNLSLVSSLNKSKEVGVRKVLGAGKGNIFWQQFFNVAVQCVMSLIISLFLMTLIVPWFSSEFKVELSLFKLNDVQFYLQLFIALVLITLLAGAYPSLVLTRFNPVEAIKGKLNAGKTNSGLRNGLVIVQFVFSAFFIICSLVIYKQISYMQSSDKGFSGEQVLRIETTYETREKNFDAVRQNLMSIPGVLSVAKSTTVPADKFIDTSSTTMKWKNAQLRMNEVKVSTDYFQTIGAELISGRMFDDRYADQHTRSVIINEAAAAQMNTTNPVGQVLTPAGCDTVPTEVIGVVKNFQVQGAAVPVRPAMFLIGNYACGRRSGGALLVKLQAGNPQQTIAAIENVWKDAEPAFPIRYAFLNENFQKLFAEYQRVQKVVGWFTVTALFIALMGLFALSAYLIKQKTKELSIRKILGADALDIYKTITGGYLINITIAIIIAIPLGWFATQKWLQSFAFRFQLSWTVFAIAALSLLAIAAITVSFQAIKVAIANPVKSLRTE